MGNYQIQAWINDSLTTPVNASRLGHIEQGISDARDIADQAIGAVQTVNSGVPGAVYFDTFFAGADDNAKVNSMNTWAAAASGPTPVVLFAARQYNHSTPIQLYAGLKLGGSAGFAAREFSRGTVINYTGGAGTSQMAYPASNPRGMSDNSPRDVTMTGIQFQGGTTTHFLPKLSPGSTTGTVLWYCQFHNCCWKQFDTVWWGAGTGTSISGVTHLQVAGQQGNAPFNVGGSENSLFGNDVYSFADRQVATGTPLIRTSMQKSYIGKIMITARQTDWMISVEGGNSITIDGLAFDSQSGDPVYGAGLKITGGDGVVVSNCSFKGVATAPASATGGASANKGWIHATGGRQVLVQGCQFLRGGNNMPATSFPVLYAGSSTNEFKWGLNNYSNYSGSPAVVQQAASGKIFTVADPSISVVTAA